MIELTEQQKKEYLEAKLKTFRLEMSQLQDKHGIYVQPELVFSNQGIMPIIKLMEKPISKDDKSSS